jgi:radical SAM family uncharacterized protein
MLYEDLLLQVNKPARYIGNEWNAVKKDLTKVDIKIALCFPDVYEVGMSHLGLRILYCLLNNREDIACERVFTPWVDMEDKLRSNYLELFSLESHTPLREFDIIGFSLLYEMNYTNVLNTLDLASIPLRSSERSYPLIIAGGTCCLNPEPMVEFIDLFIIGEAEEVILEVVDVYKKTKHQKPNTKHQKSELFYRMAQIEGVYVPSLYEVEYYPDGKLKAFIPKEKFAPLIIKKRIITDLNKTFYPTKPMVPFIEIIHDRISLEIMRGCPNRCRFCQAKVAYFPKRERSPDEIVRLARESFLNSGYEEVSLISLSTGDYSDLEKVVEGLINLFKEKGISISLPSLKPDAGLYKLPGLIAQIKKTGLTFAIEAGTERLREIIGKDINIEEFSRCLIQAYKTGWQRVKLYFLIGLPTETQSDLDGIIELATSASDLRGKIKGLSAFVTLSINSFIPKPHTPFQWLPMADTQTIREKQACLRSGVKPACRPGRGQGLKVKLNFHDYKMSFIEAVLSLGDRRLNKVIFKARQKGCKFDGWREHFKFDLWMEAFKDCSIDPHFYVNRQKALNELLPWDHIDVGLSKEWLKREAQKVIAQKVIELTN